jgi:hypothetical protein
VQAHLLELPPEGDCPTDFALRLSLAEGPESAPTETAPHHTAGCDLCGARLRELRAETDAFRTLHPWPAMAAMIEGRQPPRL